MKKSIFSLLAVVTMAGCTQGDVVELVPNENVEIKLTSSAIAAETMTRAPYDDTPKYIRQTTALCISAACIRLRIGALRPMTNASLHSMAARM